MSEAATTPLSTNSPAPQPAARAIRKGAVLGAGTMGSRIAAHLANAGLPVVLLDIPAPEGPRNAIAAQALEALRKSKPPAFFDPAYAARITTGNFDDDAALLADCDWVIEAVTENLAIKQALLQEILPHLKPEAILTTNTSGLPVASIASALPAEVRRRWFGTHFFNPPRYMRLLEIVPTAETDPAAIAAIVHFANVLLGKEVVMARDTPNFIGNRIGIFIALEAVRLMIEEDLTIEEVDALTGTVIGWPRTATFRLADLVGIDVLAHVAGNFASSNFGAAVMVPPFIATMLERGWLGDKTGQGFYRKEKGGKGEELRFALDWKTLEYLPAAPPKIPAVEMAKNADKLSERLAQLLAGDVRKDKFARFHWWLLCALWNYAADCLPEIADSAASVDRVMRAGYYWEMGPFQMWDAAGVATTVERMRAAGVPVSPNVERLLASGAQAWYRLDGRECFDLEGASYRPVVEGEGAARIAWFRSAHGVIKQNPGCSLIDLGDGVACLGIAFEEECDRRGYHPAGDRNLLARKRRGAKLRGLRDRRGCRALLRGRQHHAASVERAGGRVGGNRFFRAGISAHDRGHQVLPASGGGGAVLVVPGRRRGNRHARGPAAGTCGTLHGAGGNRGRPVARGRRL